MKFAIVLAVFTCALMMAVSGALDSSKRPGAHPEPHHDSMEDARHCAKRGQFREARAKELAGRRHLPRAVKCYIMAGEHYHSQAMFEEEAGFGEEAAKHYAKAAAMFVEAGTLELLRLSSALSTLKPEKLANRVIVVNIIAGYVGLGQYRKQSDMHHSAGESLRKASVFLSDRGDHDHGLLMKRRAAEQLGVSASCAVMHGSLWKAATYYANAAALYEALDDAIRAEAMRHSAAEQYQACGQIRQGRRDPGGAALCFHGASTQYRLINDKEAALSMKRAEIVEQEAYAGMMLAEGKRSNAIDAYEQAADAAEVVGDAGKKRSLLLSAVELCVAHAIDMAAKRKRFSSANMYQKAADIYKTLGFNGRSETMREKVSEMRRSRQVPAPKDN